MLEIAADAVELSTPSAATMPVEFYTLTHRDTGESLGRGGPLDHRQVLAALRRMGARRREEWQVIGWVRDRLYEEGGHWVDVYRVGFEVSAREFHWAHHPPPGEFT